MLSSNGVAPRNETIFSELQAKHLAAPPSFIPQEAVSVDSVTVDSWAVLGAIKSFPKGTPCGCDGLRAQHLMDVMSGATSAVADEMLHRLQVWSTFGGKMS